LIEGKKVFTHLKRRNFPALAVGSLASLMLSHPRLQAATGTQRVSVALAGRSSLFHLPLVLAELIGFFKAEGIEIDWVDCDSGMQAVQLALNGRAEVVSGAFEHVLDLQALGHPYRAFVMQGRAPQISVALHSRRAALVKTAADTKPLKMGISAKGSATHWVAQHWIRQSRISAEQIQFVELGANTGVLMEAIRSGSIDSLSYVDPIVHYLEQKYDFVVLADTRTLISSQRMFGGAMVSACLFATDDFLKKRAEVTQGLANGVVRALNWLKTAGPSDILKTIPSAMWMGDRAMYLGAFEKVRESYCLDGTFQKNALENAWRARANRVTDVRVNRATLGQSFTNEWIRPVKRKTAI